MTFESHPCDHVWTPFAASVTTAVVAAILIIITVPGNLLICWAVIWNPTRNLRSPFNYLVLNLAIADLTVGAVTEPVFVGFHSTEALKHQHVEGVKWVVSMSYFMSSTASVLSMVALSVNRYQLLATQNRSRRCKTSSVVVTSALLWIFSLGLPLLYLAVGFYMLAFIFVNTTVAVSIGVLVFVYYRIHRSLQQHERNTDHIRSRASQRKKQLRREEKNTMSFILIIISFLACAVPSLVMIYVINLCYTCSCVLIHWFTDLQYLFLLVNSASNQFLYAWRMRSFRKAFQTIPGMQWATRKLESNRVHRISSRLQLQEVQNIQRMSSSQCGSVGSVWILQSCTELKSGEVLSLTCHGSGVHATQLVKVH